MKKKTKAIMQILLMLVMAVLFAFVPISYMQQVIRTNLATVEPSQLEQYEKKSIALDSEDYNIVSNIIMWERHQAAVQSVRSVFGREEGDVADVDEGCLSICTSVTLKSNQIQDFTAFLKTMLDIAEESDGSLSYTAEFVPIQMDTFAAMILDMDKDGIVPRFFKF